MYKPQADIFVLVSASDRRDLLAGTVVEVDQEKLVIRLHDPLVLQPGTPVLVHCEVNNKFMQQGATVQAYLEGGDAPTFGLILSGEPISAENRTMIRVSLAAANMKLKFGKDTEAVLLDVSPAGFAVRSTLKLNIAQVINVSITFEGKAISGEARVQSIRDMGGERTRYGLHAIETSRGQNPLQRGLGQMTAAVQRQQLRRRAGA